MIEFNVGCLTTVAGVPPALRACLLQVHAQTVRPVLHSLAIVGGELGHLDYISDLRDEGLLLSFLPAGTSNAAAYNAALGMLFERDIDLFCCIDSGDLYRRDYLEAILAHLGATAYDEAKPFCLNLIKQSWINGVTDNVTRVLPFHFEGGLGLAPEEQQAGQRVGAPGTFVINRPAAALILPAAEQDATVNYTHHDVLWRKTLLAAGVNIELVPTPHPVYAMTQGRIDQALRQGIQARRTGARYPKVSVVIPTYNEGDWLRRTVESVRASKCRCSFEIVVVDDGCEDGSVEPIRGLEEVRIVQTDRPQSGLIVAKNLGAKVALGEYLCFIDSHMLVQDQWLDVLLETCEHNGAADTMVTCNIVDVRLHGTGSEEIGHQYGYTLANWTLSVRWHHYGLNRHREPYPVPLCPGGMMFLRKSRLETLGGFAHRLRKWGVEDVEISLRHYCAGGRVLADPRTLVYHYYKDLTENTRSFSISYGQTSFNSLYVARLYLGDADYRRVREALTSQANLDDVVAEIESGDYDAEISKYRSLFSRTFDDWCRAYPAELSNL